MENVEYRCAHCGYASVKPGYCAACKTVLVATCKICGNPVVGEQISLPGKK